MIINLNAGDNLQSAINSASLGDTITLPPQGATNVRFTGNFFLPNKVGSSYLTITTRGSIPSAGTRISPSNFQQLAKLESVVRGWGPLVTHASAKHYKIIGIEFVNSESHHEGALVELGSGDTDTFGPTGYVQNNLSLVPDDLILDRCYIHGDSTGGIKRGVSLNCSNGTITECYISDCKRSDQDAQAAGGWNGPGPFTINNSYLEASGENVLFGGADSLITNLIPSDILIQNCNFFKQLSWRGVFAVKNLLELKCAQRVRITNNVMQNCWVSGQNGYAIQFTVRNQDGSNPWNTVKDVEFDNNTIDGASSGFNILGEDDEPGRVSVPMTNVNVHHNLLKNIDPSQYGGDGWFLLIQRSNSNLTFNHNTCINPNGSALIVADGPNQFTNFIYRNNIGFLNNYGIHCSVGEGNAALAAYFPSALVERNIFIGSTNGNAYPTNNFYPALPADVGFVSYP